MQRDLDHIFARVGARPGKGGQKSVVERFPGARVPDAPEEGAPVSSSGVGRPAWHEHLARQPESLRTADAHDGDAGAAGGGRKGADGFERIAHLQGRER